MMKKYFGREEFLAALTDKYPWGHRGKDMAFLIFSAEEAKKAESMSVDNLPELPAAVGSASRRMRTSVHWHAGKSIIHSLLQLLGKIDCFAMNATTVTTSTV